MTRLTEAADREEAMRLSRELAAAVAAVVWKADKAPVSKDLLMDASAFLARISAVEMGQ